MNERDSTRGRSRNPVTNDGRLRNSGYTRSLLSDKPSIKFSRTSPQNNMTNSKIMDKSQTHHSQSRIADRPRTQPPESPRHGRRSTYSETSKELSLPTSNYNNSNNYHPPYVSALPFDNMSIKDHSKDTSPTKYSPISTTLPTYTTPPVHITSPRKPPSPNDMDTFRKRLGDSSPTKHSLTPDITSPTQQTSSSSIASVTHDSLFSTPSYDKPPSSPRHGRRSSTPPLPVDNSRRGLIGLRNLGNTCFMNSILQCLSATDSLTRVLLQSDKDKRKKNGIVQAYVEILKQMWSPEPTSLPSCITPTAFKQRIERLAPQFRGYDQHDSQEFLRFLVSGLHDELNHPSSQPSISPLPSQAMDNEKASRAWKRSLAFDNSDISAIFMGQLKSTLKCQTCNHTSVTFDPFWDLSLPIPKSTSTPSRGVYSSSYSSSFSSYGSSSTESVTLYDCFSLFTATERLDKDNKPFCEKCNSLQSGTKQLSVHRFPEILVLHLKRFSGLHYRTKLSTLVKFKERITLKSSEDSEIHYQLYAISNHSGSCFGGHYTAYCKHRIQDKWYQFSDTSVSPVSPSSICSTQAYVLFYKKIQVDDVIVESRTYHHNSTL